MQSQKSIRLVELMRVAGIVYDSIVDGEGLRDSIYLQGCLHNCPGCHNPQTHDLQGGYKLEPQELAELFANRSNNITISGGEPLLQIADVIELLACIKNHNPNKTIWLYTGFKFEDIPFHIWFKLYPYVDVVVDGKFDNSKKDTDLRFRGSTNQRLINLNESLNTLAVVEYELDEVEV